MRFKIGDRVVGYKHPDTPTVGHVESVWNDDVIAITPDRNLSLRNFHFKQCRRLVKKNRRRIWMSESSLSGSSGTWTLKREDAARDMIEFVEVKKK